MKNNYESYFIQSTYIMAKLFVLAKKSQKMMLILKILVQMDI